MRMMRGFCAFIKASVSPTISKTRSFVQSRAFSCTSRIQKYAIVAEVLTTHRKQYMLEVLRQSGQIVAKDLSQELGLSEDTIRRDLRELAKEGLLHRVHGGALPVSPGE